MKTTRMRKIVTVSAMAIFLLSSVSYAGHSWYGNKEKECGESKERSGKSDRFEKLTEELGLSKEQSERLKAEREVFKNKNRELKENLKAKRKELKAELEKPEIDRPTVDRIIKEMSEINEMKLRDRVDKIIATKNILTPEQFGKLQEKMEEKRRAYRRDRKDHHRGER